MLAVVVCVCSGDIEIREQRDEHPTVQLFTSPVLAAQLHGRLHVVTALRRRERYATNYTVDRKKRGSTFDIITVEKHARFS